MDGLFVLLGHVIGVSQIVEGWIMERVYANGLQVELYCFRELATVAICISKVIETFYFLWVDI